jgi:hypothetical protein
VLDAALRYTVDKTTREILFMPLPTALKYRPSRSAVSRSTVRERRGLRRRADHRDQGVPPHLVAIELHQPGRDRAVDLPGAARAPRIPPQLSAQPGDARDGDDASRGLGADLSTIETLVQELSQPDATRVVYAIDMLESLDKRNLVTPLLLYHESPEVRRRALRRDRRGAAGYRAALAAAGQAHARRR